MRWDLVAGAIGWNLLSVVVRAMAWRTVINQATPAPHPRLALVFSAFSVGLFANAVLPGRVGELARVAVVQRKTLERRGLWATLVGTVFAHRIFDVVPVVGLIFYTLATAQIPAWATSSLVVVVAAGIVLFLVAFVGAKRHPAQPNEDLGRARQIVRMAREGLAVMHRPAGAAAAIFFQCLGWLFQLFAVYTTMRAFQIHAPLPAVALVLLLMNVATIVPLWPGNFGAVQALIAVPLSTYNVDYGHAFAFGVGLQAIEASVGVGVGAIFLLREGLSYAMLKEMPGGETAFERAEAAVEELEREEEQPEAAEQEASSAGARARG